MDQSPDDSQAATESQTDEVVAACYQGFASVRSKGWFKDTHFYVRSVKALKDRV